ncbi:MAG TPA: Mu-like prophage major head subunit gpT family protein, partial [Ktedonobacterales bacterium]
LERAMSEERETLAALAGLGLIREMGYEKAAVSSMVTEAEKIQAAFDRMFDLEVDARFAGVRAFSGIREAYARVSGDPAVRGISNLSTLGMIKVDGNAPLLRITESDITTASFSYLLGTSMNKRLLHDYQAWPAEWRRFCTEVPIKDFKQQTRVRLGSFGSLATVAEDAAYTTLTLGDGAATYSASKRGNLVTVSRETIVNDDLHAIKQIPTKLAAAAAYTLAEFVYGFLSSNATIYDTNALFDAANHKNLGATALASSAVQAGVTAMREQTNFAGKRIGLRPKYLIVPPELEFTSLVIVKSAGVPGSNNNDINPMMGYTQLIVSPQLPAAGTPANSSWYLAADPAEVDTIEIGFVGGQVNPAMFIQDNPLYGLNFTQDAVSYKVRHEYGGAVMDWRGLYRGI